jgi:peroxiredoxin
MLNVCSCLNSRHSPRQRRKHLAQGKFSSLVVVFYRGTWCAYCNIYLRGLLETRSLLSDANASLIAVSPEAAPVSFDDASAAGPTFPVRSYDSPCLSGRQY